MSLGSPSQSGRSRRLRRLLASIVLVLACGVPPACAAPPAAHAADRERAAFARCGDGRRVTCVVDGDTFWYRGEKIRVADINAPELGHPQCAYEARLAEAATERFTALLNAGAFSLVPVERATDKYGRSLYIVARADRSLGATLEAEGLAEHWRGFRRDWC